jgi:hypothetical protein
MQLATSTRRPVLALSAAALKAVAVLAPLALGVTLLLLASAGG